MPRERPEAERVHEEVGVTRLRWPVVELNHEHVVGGQVSEQRVIASATVTADGCDFATRLPPETIVP